MFEQFTAEARTAVIHAQQHARRLGHRFIGCEHVLLALVSSEAPAGAVLRGYGLTPEAVEEQIVRRVGLGAGAGLFADLDREALASIGVDLDAVRARIETSFAPDVLTRAGQISHRCHPGRRLPHRFLRRWRRRRHAAGPVALAATRPAPATGRYQAPGALPTGHLPFTPAAKQVLAQSLREAVARRDSHIGVEHLALGVLETNRGLVPPILSALDAPASALRAAIVDQYRQAS